MSGSGKSTLVNDILLAVPRPAAPPGQDAARPAPHDRRASSTSTRWSTSTSRRSAGRRVEPGHLHRRLRPHPQALRQTPEAKVRGYQPGRFSFNVEGRPLRGLRGRRHDQDRDALPARRLRARARSARAPATTATRSRSPTGASRSPTCSTCRARRRSSFFADQPSIARHLQTLVDVGPRLRPPRPARADAVGRRGPAGQAGHRAGAPADRPHLLHPRRADDRPALRGRPEAARRAAAAWSTRATRSS